MTDKYALLIGINYTGSGQALQGCLNDVASMKKYLIEKRIYPPDNIVVLLEKNATHNAILIEFSQLMLKSHFASEIFLSYSGHGSYLRDIDNDENDGNDECIIPYDMHNHITDDVLHSYLKFISNRCKAFFCMDCCHSGTILDLQYSFSKGHLEENKDYKLTGDIVCISGCLDSQVSADAAVDGRFQGAMTAAFLHCAQAGKSVIDVTRDMREWLAARGFAQFPLLQSTVKNPDRNF